MTAAPAHFGEACGSLAISCPRLAGLAKLLRTFRRLGELRIALAASSARQESQFGRGCQEVIGC